MQINYPPILDFYTQDQVDLLLSTTSGELQHTHVGLQGITVTRSGSEIQIEGPVITGIPNRVSATLSGNTWTLDVVASGVVVGNSLFNGQDGALIFHDLNTLHHAIIITPTGSGNFDPYWSAYIGDIYVQRGATYDTVYTTSTGSIGCGFSWIAIANYVTDIMGSIKPCIDCDGPDIVAERDVRGRYFQGEGINYTDGSFQQSAANPGPNYEPPNLYWASSSGLYIPEGRYFKCGPRVDGQYIDFDNMGTFWDITGSYQTLDISATYSGSQSGVLDGGRAGVSWYSVYMVGSGTFVALPYVVIKSVDYDVRYAGYTTLTPGWHRYSGNAELNHIKNNNAWNDYRLFRIQPDNILNGKYATIYDTINDASGDMVMISGNVTTQGVTMASGQWYALAPPAGTPSLYLGSFVTDIGGNVVYFVKKGWDYSYGSRYTVSGTLATTFANSFAGWYVCPQAAWMNATMYTSNENSGTATQLIGQVAYGTTDNIWAEMFHERTAFATAKCTQDLIFPMINPCYIRNRFQRWTSSLVAGLLGYFYVNGWKE